MGIPRFIVSTAVLVELLPIAGGAQTIDNQLGDQSWSSFAYISANVAVENGALRIQSEPGGPGDSGLITKCSLNADFDAQWTIESSAGRRKTSTAWGSPRTRFRVRSRRQAYSAPAQPASSEATWRRLDRRSIRS